VPGRSVLGVGLSILGVICFLLCLSYCLFPSCAWKVPGVVVCTIGVNAITASVCVGMLDVLRRL
jgi:predicted benzoate:H+ symporter BenE